MFVSLLFHFVLLEAHVIHVCVTFLKEFGSVAIFSSDTYLHYADNNIEKEVNLLGVNKLWANLTRYKKKPTIHQSDSDT